ncbi:class I SAM-dependent DNA methyltransferase, partial [bacterium]|nr:class I SAM-dependent DNA methyltransferase [bacterium]
MSETSQEQVEAFIAKWSNAAPGERAQKDHFFLDMCAALGVDPPDPRRGAHENYRFEKLVKLERGDGETHGSIDFYKQGCFVIEAKQGSEAGDLFVGTARRGTAGWDKAMRKAFGQAREYAHALPEGLPPFLMTCDIGNCFEVWTAFTGNYAGYGARRTIELADLADPKVREFFVKVFTDPYDLDPARHAQRVTRKVAAKLADLARALEKNGNDPELTAQFLMRCLFTMFAEDVGLLPENLFTRAVEERWIEKPHLFPAQVQQLWRAMNDGASFGYEAKLLRFNGGLFANTNAIAMTADQLRLLLDAAKCDWAAVEPTIFGTLLERALDPYERQKLGAHFTPREYIERLVRPAVIEPLRAEWEIAQAEAQGHLKKEDDAEPTALDRKKAAGVIRAFHDRLVHTRVLDPACGSGNFLYVTLDLFKQIESEILRELSDLGVAQAALEIKGRMVNPGQFLGIEINPRAREIADLVLWIGYLQWQKREADRLARETKHAVQIPEPVLRDYKNIVCRDAVLDYDGAPVPRLGPDQKPVSVWDMRTYKTHPITGKPVPDENARVPVMDYINPRPAKWPEADYVVSNPPFIGNWRMRQALGEGYAEAVRRAYPNVPESADYVMYWWEKAAELVRAGKVRRFGFITTNSLRQSFARRVIARHIEEKPPLSLAFAIPDHPWVESADGAAVRIAMTVGEAGRNPGKLLRVTSEKETGGIAREVSFTQQSGLLNADLTVGVDVTAAILLEANANLANRGVCLFGAGFIVNQIEAVTLGLGRIAGLEAHIRPYLNGKDLMQKTRNVRVIDIFGLEIEEVREKFPAVYQWVLERVKPERDTNKRAIRKKNWWIFGEPNPKLRQMLDGLPRYIATTETSKHRVFQFLDAEILPDNMLVCVALDDAWFLGVMSSRTHVTWALAAGGRLGVGNDPRYNKTRCFDPFPFPDPPGDIKARIRDLGERLDAHRKRVQAEHPDVTLTGMYNALERLREFDREKAVRAASAGSVETATRACHPERSEGSPALTEKERAFHEKALVGVLKQIHDELDDAVADAYGWPRDLSDEEILERLVALNGARAEEEKRGVVRWLRPEFQNPAGATPAHQPALTGVPAAAKAVVPA